MSKFPFLETFRGFYSLAGWVIIVGGAILALESSKGFNGQLFQNISAFAFTFGSAFFFGGSMVLIGEVINVLVRIEDHLDSLRRK